MALSNLSSNISKSPNIVEIYKGQSKDLELTVLQEVRDATGALVEQAADLTGATAYITVKHFVGDPAFLISKTSENALDIQITIPKEGIVMIYFDPDDTVNMEAKTYVFDIWVKLANGKQYPVVEASEFRVLEPVTVI